MPSSFTIISTEDCVWCVKAKDLLKENHIPFREVSIPHSLSKNEFSDIVEKYNTTKTVPKIFNGKKLIGGYKELVKWIESHGAEFVTISKKTKMEP